MIKKKKQNVILSELSFHKPHFIFNPAFPPQVVVISGETGCGKSTQVPQYILDDWLERFEKDGPQHAEIVCTQPRRISAIGVAERVAEERVEKAGQVVGYQVRRVYVVSLLLSGEEMNKKMQLSNIQPPAHQVIQFVAKSPLLQ